MSIAQPVSLNLNVRGMGQSATLAIKQKCRELRQQGKQVFDFGLGQSPFPVPDPVVEALRLAAPEKDYLPVHGLPALREAVAEFHRKKDMIDARPDGVLVGPGSKELMFILQIVYYGEIILRTPCWVSYMPQARIIGRRISLIPTSYEAGWKITPDWLMKSLKLQGDDARPRLLIMNYPSNPTGHTYSADELKELVEVIRQFEIVVLSDEIYGQTHFSGEHVSVARFYPERTIVSSGLSKWCGAGGWRLGTFSFPPELDWLRKAMAAVASETYTSVSAPIQYAAVQAFHGGAFMERYLWHCRQILGALASQCVQILTEGGIRVHAPHGGFYLFLDFSPLADRLRARGIDSGAELCDRLVEETGVAILPGAAFGRSREELTARLSYVDFDGAAAIAANEATAQEDGGAKRVVEQYCARVIEGIERIVEWSNRTP
jgi:aspartate aminotransferase